MDLESGETSNWTSDVSGITNGRNDNDSGATGVTSVHGTEGATIGPPAVMEYAVDPDGVATINPSAQTVATYDPSIRMSTVMVLTPQTA